MICTPLKSLVTTAITAAVNVRYRNNNVPAPSVEYCSLCRKNNQMSLIAYSHRITHRNTTAPRLPSQPCYQIIDLIPKPVVVLSPVPNQSDALPTKIKLTLNQRPAATEMFCNYVTNIVSTRCNVIVIKPLVNHQNRRGTRLKVPLQNTTKDLHHCHQMSVYKPVSPSTWIIPHHALS